MKSAYVCNICPSRYTTSDSSMYNAQRHRRSVGHTRRARGLGPVERVWKCTACFGAVFARSDHFRVHLKRAKCKRNREGLRVRTERREHRSTKSRARAEELKQDRLPQPLPQVRKEGRVDGVNAEVTSRIQLLNAKRAAMFNMGVRRLPKSNWHQPFAYSAWKRADASASGPSSRAALKSKV